ncbi:ABC transporter permease [soil metagenome]
MNATIARLSWQSVVGQRRGILLALLPALLVALSILTVALTQGYVGIEPVTMVFGFSLVLPLVALLVTNGVLGPEIEDGSIVYLLSKPISRYTVVVSKVVVALLLTVVLGAGSVFVSALILQIDEPGQAFAIGVGALAASFAYCGLFVALATLTRHGTIAGLIYVIILEGALASWLDGLRYISMGFFGRRIVGALDDGLTVVSRDMNLAYACSAVVVVTVGGVWLAGRRMRSFELRGED